VVVVVVVQILKKMEDACGWWRCRFFFQTGHENRTRGPLVFLDDQKEDTGFDLLHQQFIHFLSRNSAAPVLWQ
jgi:hypothetical protein